MTARIRRSVRFPSLLLASASALAIAGAGCAARTRERPRPAPTPNEVLYERARTQLGERRFEKARQTLSQIGTSEVQSPELDPLVKIATADAYFYDPGIANVGSPGTELEFAL